MSFFHPGASRLSPEHTQIHIAYEFAFTIVDFSAALLFVVGSIFFFWEETTYMATWMFLIGSLCFAAKPTIRLLRELAFRRAGKTERLAAGHTPSE